MKEEQFLLNKLGRENHFCVPDDYFDNFAQQFMDALPAGPEQVIIKEMPRSIFLRLAKPLSVAACACVVLLSGMALFMRGGDSNGKERFASAQYSSTDYDIDRIADYAMLSNEDMYSYLLDE